MRILILILLLPIALSGCVVGTIAGAAVDVVTLPVKAASKGVDLATTSQSEADENRGRALRKAQEDYGRRYRKWQSECRNAQTAGQACPPAPEYTPPGSN